ncbi:restriction endonuclease [Marinomonas algicola]|uniref:restriction endonuclease n=1 Tax=Marinomonas algicola TaxID=2773454 RepID=UPI00174EC450|nr:restriction endonuclease [Marinomonas algicola]
MLDFNELSTNRQNLEQLTRELLFSMGYQVYWNGRGPDGGRDLICIDAHNSRFRDTSRKWLIQCK